MDPNLLPFTTYFLQLPSKLRCDRVTPFGIPVVPEEHTINAV